MIGLAVPVLLWMPSIRTGQVFWMNFGFSVSMALMKRLGSPSTVRFPSRAQTTAREGLGAADPAVAVGVVPGEDRGLEEGLAPLDRRGAVEEDGLDPGKERAFPTPVGVKEPGVGVVPVKACEVSRPDPYRAPEVGEEPVCAPSSSAMRTRPPDRRGTPGGTRPRRG
jgi:hypothetical protein